MQASKPRGIQIRQRKKERKREREREIYKNLINPHQVQVRKKTEDDDDLISPMDKTKRKGERRLLNFHC